MVNSKVDPVYKYIDDKLKLVNREIQRLKVAHDAVANQHAQKLLEIQRIVVGVKINADVASIRSIIDSQLPQKASLVTQLVADAAAGKAQLNTSKTPVDIGRQFLDKWKKMLHNLGADVIEF